MTLSLVNNPQAADTRKTNSGLVLKQDQTTLLVIDVQERFLPVIANIDEVVAKTGILLEMARHLEIPVCVSEQYPKGLGHTVEALKQKTPEGAYWFEKHTFNCLGNADFATHLRGQKRPQVLIAGIETQVCVNQTVMQLLEEGYRPYLVVDAISSRNLVEKDIALRKLVHAGAVPVTLEMVLFELLQSAEHPLFKTFLQWVK